MGEQNIAVLGGGSFGTVLANILGENGHSVHLWLRDAEVAEAINQQRVNTHYLPDVVLSSNIVATTDMGMALAQVDCVFASVPSSAFRSVIQHAKTFLPADITIVSTTKGIEPDGFRLMSQVLADEMPTASIGVLSGPNLAKEVAARQLTATVIASPDQQVAQRVQSLLHTSFFRVYSSNDMYGVELGGALKNIYAIVAGFGAAMGVGQNTLSMLATRSLAEMGRFAVELGANPMTFLGLAGVGDLIVTCMSPLSRNYQVGYALGQGKTLQQAVSELGQVAEGVNTLRLVHSKAEELGIYMPLVNGLYEILFNDQPVEVVIERLMMGEQNSDVEFSQHYADIGNGHNV